MRSRPTKLERPGRVMGPVRLFLIALVLGIPAGAAAQGHPAMRYSCMSPLPPGEPVPWVDDGVPDAIERLHPGYTIRRFVELEVPGLTLFEIVGGRRAEGIEDRYRSVEATDETGRVLTGRALFVRAAAAVTDPDRLARLAMAILLFRAGERPLRPRDAASLTERVRPLIAAPAIADGTLVFWVRVQSDLPYASEVRVELATGIHHGDAG